MKYYSKDFTNKLYLEVPGFPAIWLNALFTNITYCYNKVDALINDDNAREKIREQYESYVEKNQSEFEKINESYDNEKMEVPVFTNGENGLYDEVINADNKIITIDNLRQIFEMLNKELNKYLAISKAEVEYNDKVEFGETEYTCKNTNSNIHASVSFKDSTDVSFDSYDDFIQVFDKRINEIKYIWFYFSLSYQYIYTTFENKASEYIDQHLNLYIDEKSFDISSKISSKDKKLNKEYDAIKQIVLNAPEKYSYIIKKRGILSILFSVAYGLIPALLLSLFMIGNAEIMKVIKATYVAYPLLVIFISFVIGQVIYLLLVSGYYKNIIPDQEYVKYDSNKGKSIYQDDVNKYKSHCEVLIGKNVRNLECRKKIENYMNKAKRILPFELLALAIMSVIMLFI